MWSPCGAHLFIRCSIAASLFSMEMSVLRFLIMLLVRQLIEWAVCVIIPLRPNERPVVIGVPIHCCRLYHWRASGSVALTFATTIARTRTQTQRIHHRAQNHNNWTFVVVLIEDTIFSRFLENKSRKICHKRAWKSNLNLVKFDHQFIKKLVVTVRKEKVILFWCAI